MMIKADKYYIKNLNKILREGSLDENPRPKYKDGTKAHTKFIIGSYEEYDISKNEFPITTLRNTATKTGIREILWIYQKQSNLLKDAHDLGVHWWDNWDIGNGTIGQRYGATVKEYNLIDNLLKNLKEDPFGRRHIMDMWQYEDLNSTEGLNPCAYKTTWSVRRVDGELYLDVILDQRSNDYIMAGYINKVQYVALQMMVAGHLGYKVGMFRHLVANLHIYDRHIDAAKEILSKRALDDQPILEISGNKNFYDYTIDDFKVKNIKGITKIKNELQIAI